MSNMTYVDLNAKIALNTQEIDFDTDKEAVRAYFLEHVNLNTAFFHSLEEKLEYMFKEGYYIKDVFDDYPMKFVKSLYKKAFDKKYRFRTFMGAFKFYTSYALKTLDGSRYLERYEDRVVVTALTLGCGNQDLATSLMEEMIANRFQPATPTFLNSGRARAGEPVSCFPAGTMVDAFNGRVAIENLKIGDSVLTEDGSYRKILETNKSLFSGKLLGIKPVGTPEIVCTPDHPFLIRKNVGDTRVEVETGAPDGFMWVAAKDIIALEDHVVMSKPSNERAPRVYRLMDYISDKVAPENNLGYRRVNFVEVDGKIQYRNADRKTRRKNEFSQVFNPINAHVVENEEFGRFLGWFLAEGYLNIRKKTGVYSGVVFTLGKHETTFINELVELSENIFGITPTINHSNKDGSVRINVNNSIICEFLFNLVGTGFDRKIIGTDLLEGNNEFLRGILIGCMRGDGCCVANGVIMSLVNPELIHTFKLLATKIGLSPNVRYYDNQKGNDTGTLEVSGSTLANREFVFLVNKNLHKFEFSGKYRNAGLQSFHEDFGGKQTAVVQSVREFEETSDYVYNIQVEDNPTYSVNGIVVHNCFLMRVEDNMESIGRTINSALQLSKRGGGVGILLSNLRETGAPIKGFENQSSGVIPVMKILEDSFTYANQLGARQGAGAVYLSAHHPDIMRFLDTKRENADEKIRIKTMSLGVVIPDITMKLASKNEPMYLFSPYDVQRIYGKPFAEVDITAEYQNMVDNKNIRKTKMSARAFVQTLAELHMESGYPYILFEDHATRQNPNGGKINMSNLCSEILQENEASDFNEDGSYSFIGKDISCNLGSLKVSTVMRSGNIKKTVETSIRALTNVAKNSNINSVPSIQRGNQETLAIGLGHMDLHGFLGANRIHYDSPEAIEFTSVYFAMIRYYSLLASNILAIEDREYYDGFEKSRYADGSEFEKYVTKDWHPELPAVKALFSKIGLPTKEDWAALKESVMEFGLRNKYLSAVAPTGSISYVTDSTASIHPINDQIEERKEGKLGRVFYPASGMTNENREFFKTAYEIGPTALIDLYAAATEHVDQGLSLTLFFPAEATTRDINKAQIYAWKKGIKTIYYIRLRQKALEGTEIVTQQECESCSI